MVTGETNRTAEGDGTLTVLEGAGAVRPVERIRRVGGAVQLPATVRDAAAYVVAEGITHAPAKVCALNGAVGCALLLHLAGAGDGYADRLCRVVADRTVRGGTAVRDAAGGACRTVRTGAVSAGVTGGVRGAVVGRVVLRTLVLGGAAIGGLVLRDAGNLNGVLRGLLAELYGEAQRCHGVVGTAVLAREEHLGAFIGECDCRVLCGEDAVLYARAGEVHLGDSQAGLRNGLTVAGQCVNVSDQGALTVDDDQAHVLDGALELTVVAGELCGARKVNLTGLGLGVVHAGCLSVLQAACRGLLHALNVHGAVREAGQVLQEGLADIPAESAGLDDVAGDLFFTLGLGGCGGGGRRRGGGGCARCGRSGLCGLGCLAGRRSSRLGAGFSAGLRARRGCFLGHDGCGEAECIQLLTCLVKAREGAGRLFGKLDTGAVFLVNTGQGDGVTLNLQAGGVESAEGHVLGFDQVVRGGVAVVGARLNVGAHGAHAVLNGDGEVGDDDFQQTVVSGVVNRGAGEGDRVFAVGYGAFGGGEVVGAVFVGGDAGQFLGALGEGTVDVGTEGLLQAPVDGDVLQALL